MLFVIYFFHLKNNRGAEKYFLAEIIPAELRMKLQPDPDNAGGGK